MSLTEEQRDFVRRRAENCCEYCRLPQSGGTIPFHIDHIRPLKHHGTDALDNLCTPVFSATHTRVLISVAMTRKPTNLPPLYHPRQQVWNDHFKHETNSMIQGVTSIGRTTVDVLNINEESRIQWRHFLRTLGEYPCQKID